MLLLSFFFLLQPGEYTYTTNLDATPFSLTYGFITIRGELVGLGKTGHPAHFPVVALVNHIKHLRTHAAPLTTPIYSYYDREWHRIDTITLTTHL